VTQEETPKEEEAKEEAKEEATQEEVAPAELTPEERFLLSPGPHLRSWFSVSRIMYLVVAALMFPTAAGVYFFGFQVLAAIAVAIVSAVVTEYAVKKLRGRPFIMDGGAVVTGLLLALVLPPTMPLWMIAIGSIFSIAIVKEAFGGLGFNIFNPALGGRAFLMACWLEETTTWVPTRLMPDAVTTATPLGLAFVWEGEKLSLYWNLFLGNVGGSIGETSALAILIGGGLLLALGIIEWRIPVTYIGTVALLTLVWPGQDPIFHVLAGGLMLGAFFMATDYVTSPISYRGKIIFGVGCGVVTVIVRLLGGMPEGVCFSILLMNALTPIIDRYTMVRPFGLIKRAKSEA
jgi:electron transport complex protein RnfD